MKRIFMIWIGIILIASLTACNQDALTYYQEASLKTETIDKAKSNLEMTIDFDFGEIMMKEAELTDFLDEVVYVSEAVFDRESNEKVVRQYLGNDTFGVDMVYFNQQGKEYFKVPFLGKYLELVDLMNNNALDFSIYEEAPMSIETYNQIKALWLSVVSEEDVVNLGDDVVDTPEGEVKVKKFVVTFSHDQIIGFANDVLDLMSQDEKFRDMLKSYPLYTITEEGLSIVEDYEMDVDEAVEGMRNLLDYLIISDFRMVTYIDIDQYIIESKYDISIGFVEELKDYVQAFTLEANYQLYDLHQPVTFDFPRLSEENTTDLDTLLKALEIEVE